jgi:putative membrane protein
MRFPNNTKQALFGLALTLLAVALAFAQGTAAEPLAEPDGAFLRQAAANSLWQASLGELARTQAAGGEIRRYGEDMIRENRKIEADLRSLAHRKGLSLEAALDPLQNQTLGYLAGEFGAGFDRQYASLMTDEQERNSRLYRNEAEQGRDAEIRAYAERILPWIDSQWKRARELLLGIPQPFLK